MLCLAALAGTLGLMAFFLVDEWCQPSTVYVRSQLAEANVWLAGINGQVAVTAFLTVLLVFLACGCCYQTGRLHGTRAAHRRADRARRQSPSASSL